MGLSNAGMGASQLNARGLTDQFQGVGEIFVQVYQLICRGI
jgi:hypothetical protein